MWAVEYSKEKEFWIGSSLSSDLGSATQNWVTYSKITQLLCASISLFMKNFKAHCQITIK